MDQIGAVLNKFTTLEKMPRDFGTGGDKLFPSEIHVVQAIGENPGMNMTGLAAVLGISKPAITQIIGKVMKKELVERCRGRENQKEVLLSLTKRGQIAFREHRNYHARMDGEIIKRFQRLTSREHDFLTDLFRDMAVYFDQVIREREPKISLGGSFRRKRGRE